MIKLLLVKFWPALIPIFCYVLWLIWKKRRCVTSEEGAAPRFGEGPFIYSVWASLVVLFVCFIYYFVMIETKDGEYVPSRIENGQLIPGHRLK